MKLVILVTDSDDFLGLGSAELKNEVQRSGSFLVGDVTNDIKAALRSATELRCDYMLLEAAADERRFNEQIEAIVGYRLLGGRKWLSNVVIMSPKVSEYAARRFGDANIMVGFIRPARADVIAANLEQFWVDSENVASEAAGSLSYVSECERGFADSVESILAWLDVPSSYVGYRYLVDAVLLVLRSRERRVMTKWVYPEIAIRYNKSAESVERAIRFLLPAAHSSRNWDHLFPELKELPTNSEFIFALAGKIRKH